MRAAIAGLWSDAGVINAVKAQVAPQLTTGGHPALAARVEALLRHQGAGVDTGKIARTIVKQQIGANSIQTLVFGALRTALLSAQRVTIPITNASGQASTMKVEIGTSQTVNKAASSGALNQAAEKAAGATMDAPAGKGGKAPPSLRPSGSFVSELQALTSTWTAGADTLATQAAAIKGKAGDDYRAWAFDATSAADETQLAKFLGGVVEALSASLGGEAINTFLSSTFATMMQGQIDAITAAVQTEIDAHRTATPTGTSAAPVAAPDPRVAAAVAKVSAKMRALQAAPGTASARGEDGRRDGGADHPALLVHSVVDDGLRQRGRHADRLPGQDPREVQRPVQEARRGRLQDGDRVVTALLSFELAEPGHERLVVAADGTVSYEVLAAAHPAWADRAGTFRATLDPPELRVAEALARDLVEAPPRTRGRTEPVITAYVDGHSATHPLDGPRGTAAELLSDLVDRARQNPVAVVQLAAEVLDGGDVRLAFASVGIEPVTFQVEPASLQVRLEIDGQWRDGRYRAPARFSLVAPPDGFFLATLGPASLAAGCTARGLLPGVLPGDQQVERVRVIAGGLLELGEEPGVDDLFGDAAPPLHRFRVTSPPADARSV